MPISDDELNALISDLESDRVERKGSWQGDTPEKVRQAICAFSNDLPNHRKDGILLIGVSDSGSPTTLEITDKFLLTLADIKTDGKTSLAHRRKMRTSRKSPHRADSSSPVRQSARPI